MSSQDLLFSQSPVTGNNLVFNDESTVIVSPRSVYFAATLPGMTLSGSIAPVETATLATTLPGMTLTARVEPMREVTVAATLPAMSLSATCSYDNSVSRTIQNSAGSVFGVGATPRPTNDAAWNVANLPRPSVDGTWQEAQHRGYGEDAVWQQGQRMFSDHDAPHTLGVRAGRTQDAQHQTADRLRIVRDGPHQTGDHRDIDRASRHQVADNRRKYQTHNWQPAKRTGHDHGGRSGASLHRKGVVGRVGRWQKARYPLTGREPVVLPPLPPSGCYDPSGDLLFSWPIGDTNLVFICGDYTPVTPPGATVVVPVREVYIVINNVSIKRVLGNLDLPCLGLSLSLDCDSWSYGFSARFPGSVLSSIQSSEPVELEASINGVAYRLLAEDIKRERSFGQNTISVSGRGKNAVLGAPYSPVNAFVNTSTRTAQQLIGDVLTVNGVSLGWGVDFGLTDWTVPAGLFSAQGSYMDAVNTIANAAGGYVQPHPTADTLRVLPYYATAPWDWASVTPDYELPSSVTTSEGIEWKSKPEYNAVYVSGTTSGVLALVKRTGTAGDLMARMVTDPLMTHVDAARQRGLRILGDTGAQATVSLRLPVLAETGIIHPGKFVKYVDGSTTMRGVVRSVGVETSGPELWQTLGVETHA